MGKRALSLEELLSEIEDKLWKLETLKYSIQEVVKKEDLRDWNESLILIRQEMDELYGKVEEYEREDE